MLGVILQSCANVFGTSIILDDCFGSVAVAIRPLSYAPALVCDEIDLALHFKLDVEREICCNTGQTDL